MTLCDLDDASSRSRQRMITFLSETYRTSDQESRVCERLDLSSARALSSLPTLQPATLWDDFDQSRQRMPRCIG
jgi:hypothetical protein